jgi:ABC-type transporter Mla MlaB component
MLSFCVLEATGEEEATVQLWGRAVCTEARELQDALDAALGCCRHLTIDLTHLKYVDASFQALICALHRRCELAHKRITLRGTLAGPIAPARCPARSGCPGQISDGCPIWRPVQQRDADDAGQGGC